MHFKLGIVLLCLVPLVELTDGRGRPRCREGEVFSTCGRCEKTCENRNPVCIEQCRRGCFCIDGYVRNEAWKCISPERCCKSDEE